MEFSLNSLLLIYFTTVAMHLLSHGPEGIGTYSNVQDGKSLVSTTASVCCGLY